MDWILWRSPPRFDLNGGANTGGGYLETDYIFANRLYFKPVWLAYKAIASSGTPRVQVIARCFDRNHAYPGEATLWNTVSHIPGWSLVVIHNVNVTFNETEYVKFRIVGGAVDATGVVGSVWFDAIGVEGYGMQVTISETINQPDVYVMTGGWFAAGRVFNINIPADKYQWLVVPVRALGVWGDAGGGNYQKFPDEDPLLHRRRVLHGGRGSEQSMGYGELRSLHRWDVRGEAVAVSVERNRRLLLLGRKPAIRVSVVLAEILRHELPRRESRGGDGS